ncbi:MAG: Peptidoglycan-binding lysin domain protein, partial [Bacilli bacterium]|nr:Peptidoglycan-binding lysin domain protein [Bacilli bacterium]
VPALKQQNGLKSDLIYPGQTLTVSADQTSSSASPLSQVSAQASTYTVKAGDTLWQLAQDHQTSVQALESLNGLQTDTLDVGQALQISDNAPASQQLDATDPQLPDVPSQLIQVYKDAGQKYGIPWTVLAAIHKIESNYSVNRNVTSSAGAQGPMQFMPSTFAAYGVSAPGHSGTADIGDIKDAIYSTANMLAQNGYKASPDQAIYTYNHSSSYVKTVMQLSKA